MGIGLLCLISFETELNEAIPGDIRDTSTAKAIATNLKALRSEMHFQLKNVKFLQSG